MLSHLVLLLLFDLVDEVDALMLEFGVKLRLKDGLAMLSVLVVVELLIQFSKCAVKAVSYLL